MQSRAIANKEKKEAQIRSSQNRTEKTPKYPANEFLVIKTLWLMGGFLYVPISQSVFMTRNSFAGYFGVFSVRF